MPDPTPHNGFTFHANEAEKAAKQSLPTVGDMFANSASTLLARDWMGGVGRVNEAGWTQDTVYAYLDMLGHRQFKVASIAQDTAQALQDVINLYRRADGQV